MDHPNRGRSAARQSGSVRPTSEAAVERSRSLPASRWKSGRSPLDDALSASPSENLACRTAGRHRRVRNTSRGKAVDGVQRRPRSLVPLGDAAVAGFKAEHEKRPFDVVAFVNRESGGQTGVAVFKQLINLLGGEHVVNLADPEEPAATLATWDYRLASGVFRANRASGAWSSAASSPEREKNLLQNIKSTEKPVLHFAQESTRPLKAKTSSQGSISKSSPAAVKFASDEEKLYEVFEDAVEQQYYHSDDQGTATTFPQKLFHDVDHDTSSRGIRFLVCGGDGTVSWILSEIAAFPALSAYHNGVAICPLGTGNDLARSLGWGKGLQRLEDLKLFLEWTMHADAVELDRWCLEVEPEDELPTDHCFHQFENCLPKREEVNDFELEKASSPLRFSSPQREGEENADKDEDPCSTATPSDTSRTPASSVRERHGRGSGSSNKVEPVHLTSVLRQVDPVSGTTASWTKSPNLAYAVPLPKYRGYFHCYFSIGLDAEIAYHVERSRKLSAVGRRFFRAGLGKCCYGWQGFAKVGCFARQFCCNSTLLSRDVRILEPPVEQLEARKIQACLLKGRCRQLSLLNINSYGSGAQGARAETQSARDQHLELCAVRNPGFDTALFCGLAKMQELEKVQRLTLHVQKPVFMQYDGEAWFLPCPSVISIFPAKDAVRLLRAPPDAPFWNNRQTHGFWDQ
ncbi:unnamed protein product [Amoebophrya sp. A120]|nr:unnamed protein product [Amoebophrya sp. A120]|eukprot:GSA120T00012980001.1